MQLSSSRGKTHRKEVPVKYQKVSLFSLSSPLIPPVFVGCNPIRTRWDACTVRLHSLPGRASISGHFHFHIRQMISGCDRSLFLYTDGYRCSRANRRHSPIRSLPNVFHFVFRFPKNELSYRRECDTLDHIFHDLLQIHAT
jgi:hypothetical protein